MASYNYFDLMSQLQAYRDQNSGQQVMTDEMGRPMFNEDGSSRMTAVDPYSINEWNNGRTGNEGVTYSWDPSQLGFRVTQGDTTSGFQRYFVDQQGMTDLGFEDYDRKGKYNDGLRTAAALTAATIGAGLAAQWATGAGLSSGATSSLTGMSGIDAASLAAIDGVAPASLATGSTAGTAAAGTGSLTMEGILGSNFAPSTAGLSTELGAGAMYGAPTTLAGGAAAMQGASNVGPVLEQGLSGTGFGGSPIGTVPPVGNSSVRPGGQQQGNQQNPSVLDNILSGNAGGADLARLIAGLVGSNQQRNFGQDLLQRANDATPNRGFYEGQLRQTYENPSAFLQSPEYQAIQDITHNKLQRSDAAGGRLANDYGRQIGLQNNALSQLDQHRRTLSGITGQNQATYSGQNSMFTQGAQADNSWMNGLLSSLLSRGGGTPQTGTTNTGTQTPSWMNPSWLNTGSNTGLPQINLDAIA